MAALDPLGTILREENTIRYQKGIEFGQGVPATPDTRKIALYSDGTDLIRKNSSGTTANLVAQGDALAAATVTGDLAVGDDASFAGDTVIFGASAEGSGVVQKVWTTTNIQENTATPVAAVSIPITNQSAAIELTFVATIGGSDLFESTRYARGVVVITRLATEVAVAATLAIADGTIATSGTGGAATFTLAYDITAMAGAAGAVNTFSINVTIDASAGASVDHQVTVFARIINNVSSGGVTIEPQLTGA